MGSWGGTASSIYKGDMLCLRKLKLNEILIVAVVSVM